MQAYQFIKYNKDTSIRHIEKVQDTGAVICFDFEDRLLNPMERQQTSLLKEKARGIFVKLHALICSRILKQTIKEKDCRDAGTNLFHFKNTSLQKS